MTRRGATYTFRAMLLVLAGLLLPASLYASTTTVTIRGAEQHAGNGNWDSGLATLTVDGRTETVSFGQFSTVQSVASGLAAKFSLDCNSPVQAHAVGAVITFTTKRTDVSFAQISAAAVWDASDFTNASFGIGQAAPPTALTPSLAVSCTPNPVPAGGSADCTSHLPAGATGTVSFSVGTQASWSTATVDGDGWAPASTLSGLSSGSYTVTATYSGDSTYNGTTQTALLNVDSSALASSTVYSYTITPSGGPSGYAPNGNLLSYTDSVNGTWSIGSGGYDGLNRLVSASVTPASGSTLSAPPPNWCWGYDSFGNRLMETTSSSGLSGTSCPSSSTTTVQASSHSFSDGTNHITGDALIQYDAAGNTISDHSNSYLYDGDGRVCAVNNGLVMTQYIYDADGNRVAKGTITSFSCDTTSNGFQPTTSYVLGLGDEQVTEMSINSGQATWAHTNVYAGGMLVATYDPLGLHFHLTDWLGSRRVQTNAFGQIEETCANAPYGNGLLCSSPNGAPSTADDATEHHFTGKERDAESGLDFFGARYYGSNMGRWMSPDWAEKPEDVPYSSLADPQSLNLYAYVGNNPLSKADADGHDPGVRLCSGAEQGEGTCGAGQILPADGAPQQQAQQQAQAQQQIGQDPTLPTEVAPVPHNFVEGMLDEWGPHSWGDAVGLALALPTDGIGELIPEAASALPRLTEESVSVYMKAETPYVGITKNMVAREAKHGEELVRVVGGLTRQQARGVEQAIIEKKGLANLTNKINSIAKTNPIYQKAVQFGKQLLQSIGFK